MDVKFPAPSDFAAAKARLNALQRMVISDAHETDPLQLMQLEIAELQSQIALLQVRLDEGQKRDELIEGMANSAWELAHAVSTKNRYVFNRRPAAPQSR